MLLVEKPGAVPGLRLSAPSGEASTTSAWMPRSTCNASVWLDRFARDQEHSHSCRASVVSTDAVGHLDSNRTVNVAYDGCADSRGTLSAMNTHGLCLEGALPVCISLLAQPAAGVCPCVSA